MIPMDEGAGILGLSVEPVTHRPELRARLMERVTRDREPGLGSLRVGEGGWRDTPWPGVTFRKLYTDPLSGMITVLLKMEPGSVYPAHRHNRPEQCLVLEGDLREPHGVFETGDFFWGEAGSLHHATTTVNGTVLLIVADPDDDFV